MQIFSITYEKTPEINFSGQNFIETILELKDKIDVPILGIDELSSINLDEDIITALTVLGYSRNEITAVLASVEFTENELELEDRIKIVLSRMG